MITVLLDPDSSAALGSAGYYLYVFRAVNVINVAALPVVWANVPPPVLQRTQIDWNDAVSAFISTTEMAAGNVIVSGSSADVAPGQTLQIANSGQSVLPAGREKAITFDNQSSQRYTCGLAQRVDGRVNPFCAFPVAANTQQGAAPADAILIFYSTAKIDPGTIVTDPRPRRERLIDAGGSSAFANQTQGVLVTGTSDPRVLNYSHRTGAWSWDDHALWARTVAPSEPIVPLLIRSS